MNTKFIVLPDNPIVPVTNWSRFKVAEPALLFAVLLLLWCFLPAWIQDTNGSTGSVDQSIWLLVILSLLSFLMFVGLCWWLLQHFWKMMDLPELTFMVSQFKTLALW